MTQLAILSGTRLEVPSGRKFDGIKGLSRTVEKVCRGYGGSCDRVLDLLRATLVADNLAQVVLVMELLGGVASGSSHSWGQSSFDPRVTVHRVKNKFDMSTKVKGGFRNLHINLMLNVPNADARNGFLCELQVQLREIWEAEQSNIVVVDGKETTPHDRYIMFRNFRAE